MFVSSDMADSRQRYTGKLRSASPSNPKNLLAQRSPWPSRRHTPYTKTPRSGRVSRILPKSFDRLKRSNTIQNDSCSKDPESVNNKESRKSIRIGKQKLVNSKSKVLNPKLFDASSVVNKTWRVHSLSPLFNFEYEEHALKKYGQLLSAYLEAESRRGLASELEATNKTFRASFAVVKGISSFRSDPYSVEVTVQKTTRNAAIKSKTKETPMLVALLCSVGREDGETTEDVLKNSFTSLPVCLVKGPAAIGACLASWLEKQFDCRMSYMNFSPMELGWFAALWAGVSSENHSKPVQLCYALPTSVKGLKHITVDIDGKNAQLLWRCVHNNNSEVFTESEAEVFLKAIEVHFYQHFKIDLSTINLTRVGTSVALVGSEGQLKVLHSDYLQHILQQIMQTAISRELLGRL